MTRWDVAWVADAAVWVAERLAEGSVALVTDRAGWEAADSGEQVVAALQVSVAADSRPAEVAVAPASVDREAVDSAEQGAAARALAAPADPALDAPVAEALVVPALEASAVRGPVAQVLGAQVARGLALVEPDLVLANLVAGAQPVPGDLPVTHSAEPAVRTVAPTASQLPTKTS
jgi:hypothetical protein